MELLDRITGGLLGVAVGDSLGATLEFQPPQPADRRHTEISGGVVAWAPGEPTDDTDLTMALAEAYAEGFTLRGAADRFLAWYEAGPRDVGGTTASALDAYRATRDPSTSGRRDDRSAANGSLMRTLPVALARSDPDQRMAEAAAVSAVTHAEPRCVDSCIAYCELADVLLRGVAPADAVATTIERCGSLLTAVVDVLRHAPQLQADELDTSGYVLGTLGVAVWAVAQPASLEQTLISVVNRGGDADTTGAVAGGLLGVRDGVGAIPGRWAETVRVRARVLELSSLLYRVRRR